jgi:hypothetical protein
VIDADYFRQQFPTFVREYAEHRGHRERTDRNHEREVDCALLHAAL